MTKLIGLIGYPLKHSVSPIFQQAALNHYGLDINYEIWETPPEKLASVVDRLKRPEVIGANVTLPYKQRMLEFMNSLDDIATVIGALNTIVNRNGKLEGYNTDAHGFIRSLHEQSNFDAKNKNIAIIGAGGVARAICFVLINEGTNTLSLTNRTFKNTEILAESLRSYVADSMQTTKIYSYEWLSPQFHGKVQTAQLIVNCTTVGMKHSLYERSSPLPLDWIPESALVCDLVYNPLITPLLKDAEKVGAKILTGSYMLLYQGIDSFEIWTGKKAPVDIMYNEIQNVLLGKEAINE